MANKYKVGDRVVVIGLDKVFVDDPYEDLGEEYSRLLLKVGVVKHKDSNALYSVKFSNMYLDEWLFEEKHLILEKDFTQDIKDVITVLYGKNL